VPWGIFGVEPFAEYHLEHSVGDGDGVVGTALSMDPGVTGSRVTNQNQQWITIGMRLRPVVRLVIDLGVDIGIQSPGFQYGPPVPGWNLILGAAYTYDPTGSTTKVIKRTVTRTIEVGRAAPEGRLRGLVRDAKTKKPVANAIVRYTGKANLSPQATDERGNFTSYGLAPGMVTVEVSRGDDYEPATVSTNVELGAELPLDVALTPKPPREAKITIKLSDDKGAPILGAVAKLSGPVAKDAQPEGEALMAKVPAGDYTVSVDAPGFLARDKQITVAPATDQVVDLQLRKRPPESHVTITKDQIVIKGTIHFGTNNAIILPDGQQLLDEVVDVLAKNPQIRRVSVEGHTDNRGPSERNMKLSKDRAASVVEYLVKQGISPDRLASEGFGATRPLVPNLTPANRAKNRRVEFRILDQGGGAFPQ
jgi:outer membrane protein OmpA-like peptidoglycan-associated protein